jgi:hypothetical protein
MADRLILIHYPSGGYGFYLTRLINRYISGVVKVDDKFEFDSLGTSHRLPLVYGPIHFNQNQNFDISSAKSIYHQSILQGNHVLVPYCPGINDDKISETIDFFPHSRLIRLYYDDRSWPLVFFNAITKTKKGDVNKDVFFDSAKFGSSDDWARRENFSLLFENHALRYQWKAEQHRNVCNVNILSLLTNPLNCLHEIADFLGQNLQIDHRDITAKHNEFLHYNAGAVLHLQILDLIRDLAQPQALDWVKDIFWQGATNFYIKQKYGVDIPCNTYSNWFKNTQEIIIMLKNQGISI